MGRSTSKAGPTSDPEDTRWRLACGLCGFALTGEGWLRLTEELPRWLAGHRCEDVLDRRPPPVRDGTERVNVGGLSPLAAVLVGLLIFSLGLAMAVMAVWR